MGANGEVNKSWRLSRAADLRTVRVIRRTVHAQWQRRGATPFTHGGLDGITCAASSRWSQSIEVYSRSGER